MILWSVVFTRAGNDSRLAVLRDGVERRKPAAVWSGDTPKTAGEIAGGGRRGCLVNLAAADVHAVPSVYGAGRGVKMIFFYVDYVIPDFAKREIAGRAIRQS